MRRNKGFSLVELVVSMALLAIILIPVSQFFINSFKVQSKSQTKSALTRVGQYVIENFKNKNYLDFDFSDIGVNHDPEGNPLNEFEKDKSEYNYEKEIEYGGLKYGVKVQISGDPLVNDIKEASIPENFNGRVIINSSKVFEQCTGTNYEIIKKDIGETFTDNGKVYEAEYPTMILDNPDDANAEYTMLLENNYNGTLMVGIVKNFENKLKVYIKGESVIFQHVAPHGRTAEMNKVETVPINTSEDDTTDNGEILIHADIIITDLRDTSISDSFEVTFPIDYKHGG